MNNSDCRTIRQMLANVSDKDIMTVAICEMQKQGLEIVPTEVSMNQCVEVIVGMSGNGGLQTMCDPYFFKEYIEGATREGLLPEDFNTYDAL